VTTFVMITRLSPEALRAPSAMEDFEKRAMTHIRDDLPSVHWLHSWAVLGPCDYVDVFEAPDIDTAMQVSAVFRTFGRVHSEIWPATDWSRFKELLHGLPNR